MDCAMGHNRFVPRSPVDHMAVNPNELQLQQPPLSHSKPNESHQLPHASIGQPYPSQPVASVYISTAGMVSVKFVISYMNYPFGVLNSDLGNLWTL